MKPVLSEERWQDLVLEYAHLWGWWTHHHYDSRRSTPGWPDLVLLRPPELVIVELKSDTGATTPEQNRVLTMLEHAGVEVHIWRPADENTVRERLSRPRTKAA